MNPGDTGRFQYSLDYAPLCLVSEGSSPDDYSPVVLLTEIQSFIGDTVKTLASPNAPPLSQIEQWVMPNGLTTGEASMIYCRQQSYYQSRIKEKYTDLLECVKRYLSELGYPRTIQQCASLCPPFVWEEGKTIRKKLITQLKNGLGVKLSANDPVLVKLPLLLEQIYALLL